MNKKKAVIYDANGDKWERKKPPLVLLAIIPAWFVVLIFVLHHDSKKDKPKEEISQASQSFTFTNAQIVDSKPERAADFKTKPPIVKPPADHPPLQIVLGAYTYKVRFTTLKYLDANNCEAFTNRDTQEIWLTAEKYNIRENMLHELMHAALAAHRAEFPTTMFPGHYYLNDENTFVTPLAPELLQTLRDNPELAAWLLK